MNFDQNKMVLEFDDTHLYRDARSAYLMGMQDDCKTEVEVLAISSVIELYSLGKADYYFDLYAMDPKNRIQFIVNEPS
jgi:hypothetical protein